MTNHDWITKFTHYLRAERRSRPNTIASYEHDIRDFAGWLDGSVAEATRADLQRYMSDSLAGDVGPRTAARRLSSLRHLFRFLLDEGAIVHDPTRNLPIPKCWKTIPKFLSQADLDTMVNSLDSSWLDLRDRAILLTLFASGLRESELIALRLGDIDLDAGVAKVWHGKGDRDGIVALGPRAVEALKVYLESVRPNLAAGNSPQQVFLSRRGQRLTRQQVYYRVRDLAVKTLGKRISPHSLRHGFATALVEGGADIRDVQALMRHASIDTTAMYIHTDLKYLRRIYAECHPRARFAPAAN